MRKAGFYRDRQYEDGQRYFVYYCPNNKCRKSFSVDMSKSESSEEFKKLSSSIDFFKYHHEEKELTCPHCGETHTAFYVGDIVNNSVFEAVSIKKDYKRVQMNIFAFKPTFYGKKLQLHHYTTRVVFNLRTGRVTIFNPIDKNGKTLKIFYSYAPMTNMTFGLNHPREDIKFFNEKEAVDVIKDSLVPFIQEHIDSYLRFKKSHIFDSFLATEFYSAKALLNSLAIRLRFHDLPASMVWELIHARNINQYKKYLTRAGYRSKNQLIDLIKAIKGPQEKWARKRIDTIEKIMHIKNLDFIQSKANLDKLLSGGSNFLRDLSRNSFRTVPIRRGAEGDATRYLTNFVLLYKSAYKQNLLKNGNMSEEKAEMESETIIVNRILSENPNYYTMYDTMHNLTKMQEHGIAIAINTDWSFKRMHDYVASEYDKIKRPNRTIEFSDEALKLEGEFGGFKFMYPKQTHDLIEIGKSMNICVGGYDSRAYDKALNIMQVSTPDDPFVCCIEMTADYKNIRQTKINFNSRPDGELREAILDWIRTHNLKIDTYDISFNTDKENEQYKTVRVQEEFTAMPRMIVRRPQAVPAAEVAVAEFDEELF